MIIRVISAAALKDDTKKKIEAAFIKKHSQKPEFDYETDASLLGGVLIVDGDRYYDATIRGRLVALKRTLG